MEQGLAKGNLKRADEARLHLGQALWRAGRKDDAVKAFARRAGRRRLGGVGPRVVGIRAQPGRQGVTIARRLSTHRATPRLPQVGMMQPVIDHRTAA